MEGENSTPTSAMQSPDQTFPTRNEAAEDPEEDDPRSLMQQFLDQPEHSYRVPEYGDVVEGSIVQFSADELLVDIGLKSEGVVPAKEMTTLSEEERGMFQVGTQLMFFVLQPEDQEGRVVLSLDRARQEQGWQQLQQAYERQQIVQGQVTGYNKGGLLVHLEGVRGFIPSSQVSGLSRVPEGRRQAEMARMNGQVLPLKIIEINRSRNRLILSERQAVQEQREMRKGEILEHLREGEVRRGIVTSLCDFGAFVDIGGADGLIHLSELSWSRINHPSEVLQVGEEVEVYVLGIDEARKRIALSLKRTQREPWTTVGERYSLGQVIQATITQLTSFGAFARIESGVEGLIHISEMSDGHIQHPREVLQEGAVVTARIIRIDPARKRIGLSLRRLEEDEGKAAAAGSEPGDDNSSV